MKKYNVLYTSDSRFFCHMLTSIYSLLKNNKNKDIVIHIIEYGFTEYQKKLLYELEKNYSCNIILYSMDDFISVINKYNVPKWRGTDIANARLFACEFIKNLEKLLYIDSDTIIVDSIEELFNIKMNNPVGAVKELFIPSHMDGILSKYYNSGVILFDYDMWEKDNCMNLLYSCLEKNRDILFYPDQDLLNMALEGRIDTLNISYNFPSFVYEIFKYPLLAKKYFEKESILYDYYEISESLKDVVILHMLEYFYVKPWEKNSVHPFNKIYREYRTMWDNDFQLSNNNSLISKIKLISFFNCCLKAFLKKDDLDEIKKFLKIYKGPEKR